MKLSSVCVGRHALSDQAGGEGGPTEGDQTGAAQFRKTQGEWRSLLLRDVNGGGGCVCVWTCVCGRVVIGCFLLSLRRISRTTREICSCSDTTKTSILLSSNLTWRTCLSTSVRHTHTHTLAELNDIMVLETSIISNSSFSPTFSSPRDSEECGEPAVSQEEAEEGKTGRSRQTQFQGENNLSEFTEWRTGNCGGVWCWCAAREHNLIITNSLSCRRTSWGRTRSRVSVTPEGGTEKAKPASRSCSSRTRECESVLDVWIVQRRSAGERFCLRCWSRRDKYNRWTLDLTGCWSCLDHGQNGFWILTHGDFETRRIKSELALFRIQT